MRSTAAERDVTEAEKSLRDAGDGSTSGTGSGRGTCSRGVRRRAPWSTAAPPPSVDGKACPIGTANGFIDSWRFPRSGGRSHEGADMFAPMGTPLYAVADGTIWRVYNNTLGGLAINLIDDAGTMYYALRSHPRPADEFGLRPRLNGPYTWSCECIH